MPEAKLTQFLIDGPATNWSVMDKMNTYRDENELPLYVEVSNCGLYVVHGIFKFYMPCGNY